MARAGFTVISSGPIRFTKNGRWYAGTDPVENRRVVTLLNRSLRPTANGRYELVIGRERVPVEVEDAPFVITRVDGDPEVGFTVTLNDGTSERLDAASLTIGPDRALYCRVKGSLRARFLRPAHYQLGKHVQERDGRYFLPSGEEWTPLPADAAGTTRRPREQQVPPRTPLHVVLVCPEIPPNTGTIARLCAATETRLHLVGPLGFSLEDRYLRRAGLDYWPHVPLTTHRNWQSFLAARPPGRLLAFSSRARLSYTRVRYRAGDCLVFGGESRGLPAAVEAAIDGELLAIPMRSPHVRSLNLANAVSIALYEALRQLGLT